MKERIEAIRNKLQTSKTALESIAGGKEVTKEFTATALDDLNKAIELLEKLDDGYLA